MLNDLVSTLLLHLRRDFLSYLCSDTKLDLKSYLSMPVLLRNVIYFEFPLNHTRKSTRHFPVTQTFAFALLSHCIYIRVFDKLAMFQQMIDSSLTF